MPSYHYKYIYKYTKTTPVDEESRHARHHDDDSTRRRRKRHSSSSSHREESTSRSSNSLRPLWVTVNKIDNHYGSESGRHRHRDDGREDDRQHSHGHRSRSSRHSRHSDNELEYPRTHQNRSGPPSPPSPRPTRPSPSTPPSPRPKPHSSVGLSRTSSMPGYVDAGTSTGDYWYYPLQPPVDPYHHIPVSPPPPYTSTESLYGCGPSTGEVPACGLTYCGNQAVNLGYSHSPCVTMPMVRCAGCCQVSVLQGYPCLGGLHI